MSDVRFARVPTGRETCGFCFMLASQGYVYRSAATAARSHPGCDCVAVPGIPDPGDDGRFAGMRQRWQDCLDAVDNGSTLRRGKAAWAAMDGAERARHAGKRGDEAAFRAWYRDDFLVREACREVERRDRGWLYDGVPAPVCYKKPREALEKHELAAVDWLSKNGIPVVVNMEDPKAVANIDLTIQGVDWELKNVTNAGSSLKNQLARAKKKWFNMGDAGNASIVFSLYGCIDGIDDVVDALEKKDGFKQALIIADVGVRRIRK